MDDVLTVLLTVTILEITFAPAKKGMFTQILFVWKSKCFPVLKVNIFWITVVWPVQKAVFLALLQTIAMPAIQTDIELLEEDVMRFVGMARLLEMRPVMTETHMDLMAVHQPVSKRQVINAMELLRSVGRFAGMEL